jgi:hypothetical protein
LPLAVQQVAYSKALKGLERAVNNANGTVKDREKLVLFHQKDRYRLAQGEYGVK